MTPRPMLAVLGGSFSPPHLGHVLAVDYVRAMAGAARVIVLPCADHALGKVLAPWALRETWTRLAFIDAAPGVVVDDLEARLARAEPGPSHSLRMLERLARDRPGEQIRLVVGSDIVASGETARWHRWDAIERGFSPIVIPRAGSSPGAVLPELSSTALRAALERGDAAAVRAMTPPALAEALLAGQDAPAVAVIGRGHLGRSAEIWLAGHGLRTWSVSARALLADPAAAWQAGRAGARWADATTRPAPPAALAWTWVCAREPDLPRVAQALGALAPVLGAPIVQASGSVRADGPAGLGALAARGASVGTLHPIAAVRGRRGERALRHAAFGLEGCAALAIPEAIVPAWARCDLTGLGDQARVRYHAACALLANHLAVPWLLAVEEWRALGLGGELDRIAERLFRSASEALAELGPGAGVSGPASRGDLGLVEAHAQALGPAAAAVYRSLARELVARLASSRPAP